LATGTRNGLPATERLVAWQPCLAVWHHQVVYGTNSWLLGFDVGELIVFAAPQ